jgi:acyl-homoserine lactone acylase PvdQ
MERSRRFTAGRLSEALGAKALNIDKFALSIGFRRVAEETWNTPGLIKEKQR